MTAIPFVKDIDFVPGRPDVVAPGVTRVIASNPGPFTYTGTGTYLIGEGADRAVIDPGPDDETHLDAIIAAAAGAKITHILITHTHRDHCGGARLFAEKTGAPIYGFGPHPSNETVEDAHAMDDGGDTAFAPDEVIGDNAIIEGDGWRIDAVHTPGHISNHLCFAYPQENALFTGDHLMGWATTIIAAPDGDMADYMNSLDRLLERDDAIYFPTHGAPIKDPRPFVRAVKAHRLMRDGQILEAIRSGHHTIKDMVDRIYTDIDPRLKLAAAVNVFAHLIRLVQLGRIASDETAPTMKSRYTIAA